MNTEMKWEESTISNRQYVLESAGTTIEQAERLAPLRWVYLPGELREKIRQHGFEALCDYGYQS